jgi:hypothetical protein
MPLELVLAELGVGTRRRVELSIPGGWVIADIDAGGKAVISRLVATDPQAFLEPHLRPGSVFRVGPEPHELPPGPVDTDAGPGGTPDG